MDGVSIDFDLGFDSAILDAAIKRERICHACKVFAAPAARNW